VTVFALAGRRRDSLPLESRMSRSLERGVPVGSSLDASELVAEVSR
jgi:hypothetical protein